jgi:hypothetical protein
MKALKGNEDQVSVRGARVGVVVPAAVAARVPQSAGLDSERVNPRLSVGIFIGPMIL